MSVNTAEAYRIAADYLITSERIGAEAHNLLKAEADRIDGIIERNAAIGRQLKAFKASGLHGVRSDEEFGRKAWELVNADRKLHTPPTTESLTARDDIEN